MRKALVHQIAPVVHRRVAQIVLRKRAAALGRDVRQEIEDLVQDVFALCFDKNARVLRAWDPDRGLSFENFVGLIAQRETLSILRTSKRSPWTEDPTLPSALEEIERPSEDFEAKVESRNTITVLADRMRERLSPLGMQYFKWLYVEQKPVAQVAQEAKTTTGALYVWRNRLTKMIREIARELQIEAER